MQAEAEGGTAAVVLVSSSAAIVLPGGGPPGLTQQLRSAAVAHATFIAVVSAVAGADLLALPSFCIAIRDGDRCRVLVRGDGFAAATGVDGEVRFVSAGDGVTTWREEVLEGVAAVALQSLDGRCPTIELLVAPLGPAVGAEQPLHDDPAQSGHLADASVDPAEALAAAPPGDPSDDLLTRPVPVVELTIDVPPEAAPSGSSPDRRGGTADDHEFDFSHLVENTQFRGVEAAAVRPAEDPATDAPDLIEVIPGEQVVGPGAVGDHDGHTIAAGALRDLVAAGSGGSSAAGPGLPIVGASVQAVHCVAGHPNPPHASSCRQCGGAIGDRAVRVIGRPVLGLLRFSTGAVVELDRPQLVGRRPTADPKPGTELSGLVTVADPDQALSRVHAEVRIEGWDVFVVDRGSTNGTFVTIPGNAPTKLRSNEPCLVVPGTSVALADVATFTFEVGL